MPTLGELFTNVINQRATTIALNRAIADINSMEVHICTAGEYNSTTLVPTVATPSASTFYLVPDGSGNNLYAEWIYVNNAWELFGRATIDLSGYAPLDSPNFDNALSMGRKANTTVGEKSVALGISVTASNGQSVATGSNTTASGWVSHAEGTSTLASASASHAEGANTTASGYTSHAEGSNTTARGYYSHAEGFGSDSTKTYDNTTYVAGATGTASHAEGDGTFAIGYRSHAEGNGTVAKGYDSHAEGNDTGAMADAAHAEGMETIAGGKYSHAQGLGTSVYGAASSVLGQYNISDKEIYASWRSGNTYQVGDIVNYNNLIYKCIEANNDNSFITSKWTNEVLQYQYAEIVGNGTSSFVTDRSNARALDWSGNEYLMGDIYIGCNADSTGGTKLEPVDTSTLVKTTYPIFTGAISLGRKSNTTNGSNSSAIGSNVTASGAYSHAEGHSTTASGESSHAEGDSTEALSQTAHAEGRSSRATAYCSHAEGYTTNANGSYSHAEGNTTTANHKAQHAGGEFNVLDASAAAASERGNYVEIIGNGTGTSARSNARTLDWSGNEYLNGDIYVGCNADSSGGTKLSRIPDPPSTNGTYTLQATVSNGTIVYTWVTAPETTYNTNSGELELTI